MAIRDFFPIMSERVNGRNLIYLDSAATMQMPLPVMERMKTFYEKENSNIHRGIHTLSEEATKAYESARETVRQFLDCESPREIVFTSGATASVNMVANMLADCFGEGDEILVSGMEHHSNLLPWIELTKRKNATLRTIPITPNGCLDLDGLEELLTSRTKLVAITEVSNVTGIRNPVGDMIAGIRAKCDALILVDGAQGVVHERQSLRRMAPDFYCFSGHKLGAPTGTGVLYMRESVMETLAPCWFGGGIVNSVSVRGVPMEDDYQVSYVTGRNLFEPGTPNYAGVMGLQAALEFWMEQEETSANLMSELMRNPSMLNRLGADILEDVGGIPRKENAMLERLEQGLLQLEGVHVLAQGQRHHGCISFVVDGLHPYDICQLLDQCGVAVRTGHMCAQPYIERLGYERVIRASVAPYNSMSDIEYFLEYLRQTLAELRVLASYNRGKTDYSDQDMKEVERTICRELEALASPKEKTAFLLANASRCLTPPEVFRSDAYQVQECQVNTRLITGWMGERCILFADSEARIVKGILALLQEIYMDRKRVEMCAYHCELLEHEAVRSNLNQNQYDGLKKVLKQLEFLDFCREN